MENTKVANGTKKSVWNRILNIIATVLIVIVIILGVSALTSVGKGYSSVFGTAYVNVLTDSMHGDLKKGDTFNGIESVYNKTTETYENQPVEKVLKVGGFSKGDQIFVKVIEGTAKTKDLHVGDVITFWTNDIIEGKKVLNSHRIIQVTKVLVNDELRVVYVTKGDNNSVEDSSSVESTNVIGYYNGGRIAVLGSISNFLASSTGFLIFIVIPSFLILVYAIYKLIVMVRVVNKENFDANKDDLKQKILEEEKDRIRQEVLNEIGKTDEVKEVAKSEDAESSEVGANDKEVVNNSESKLEATEIKEAKAKTTKAKSTKAKTSSTKKTTTKSVSSKVSSAKAGTVKKTASSGTKKSTTTKKSGTTTKKSGTTTKKPATKKVDTKN